jgi:hypothetical protein
MCTPVLAVRGPAPGVGRRAAPFDYALFPASVQKSVREQVQTIHGLLARTSVNVVQIGLRLQFVRDRLGRLHFRPWLKAEFAWSQSTASNYMRAAKTFGDLDCLERFQPAALFALARKKVPAACRAEAIRLARRGGRVTKADAVELVERHAPAAERGDGGADRLRRLLLKAAPKLSSRDVRRLAEELMELAATLP